MLLAPPTVESMEAEREGFEPTKPFGLLDFKSSAFNHSANAPKPAGTSKADPKHMRAGTHFSGWKRQDVSSKIRATDRMR